MKTKLCGYAGCNHLTTGKYYCAKHQAIADKRNAERDAKYNATHKPFATAQRTIDYRNPEWRKFSADVIREKGCCERCGASDVRLQVHHIIPVRYAPELLLDRANVMVLCVACHRVETQREINARRR